MAVAGAATVNGATSMTAAAAAASNKYVALLRGVNVGGNSRVPMPQLRHALEAAGFMDVRTYINSGNVVFSVAPSGESGEDGGERSEVLQQMIHEVIADTFGLDIAVAVLSAREFVETLDKAPQWWGFGADAAEGDKHDAIVVVAPLQAGEVADSVGEPRAEYEREAHFGRMVFWSAAIKTFSRTRWSKVVASSEYYSRITIRNHRTMRKLADMCRQ